ncbi:MAG: glycosyltransferase [Planctomycetes bacterium]|nr:glycosyltransferase [Planctomycetota bacterium]
MRCSWLIPVRNGGPWLAEAVRSARSQCTRDDQVVVVDDGSADGAADDLPSDVNVIRQKPTGIASALEAGRRACRGAYIARLDADDRALPGRLEHQIAALEADASLGVVGGRARLFVDVGEAPEGMVRYVDWVNGLRDPHPQILVESPLFHPAVTMRARAVEEAGGYRDEDRPEDYDLWLRLVASGWRIANIDRDVVALRDHDARLTRTDPRYRREAFDACRKDHLRATALAQPRRVVVWAGSKGGRPWLRWLREEGHEVPVIIDITRGDPRQGIPVCDPGAICDVAFDVLLVAVGRRGARDGIRERIAQLRPDLVEGRDWWAVL